MKTACPLQIQQQNAQTWRDQTPQVRCKCERPPRRADWDVVRTLTPSLRRDQPAPSSGLLADLLGFQGDVCSRPPRLPRKKAPSSVAGQGEAAFSPGDTAPSPRERSSALVGSMLEEPILVGKHRSHSVGSVVDYTSLEGTFEPAPGIRPAPLLMPRCLDDGDIPSAANDPPASAPVELELTPERELRLDLRRAVAELDLTEKCAHELEARLLGLLMATEDLGAAAASAVQLCDSGRQGDELTAMVQRWLDSVSLEGLAAAQQARQPMTARLQAAEGQCRAVEHSRAARSKCVGRLDVIAARPFRP